MTPDTGPEPVQASSSPADPATASADSRPPSPAPFIVTKEHHRFAEFADAVRPGIGNQRYQNLLNVRRDSCAA
jgi:hypothetical protein